ncbi:MAG: hypothetical protein AAF389_19660 [Gemmatimonadota bacterium]
MRRFAFAMSAVLTLAVLAQPVDAQLKFGGHAALISGIEAAQELDGTFGFGGRAGLELPALPVGVWATATYFAPDCDDCSYWTGALFAKLGLPLPIVSPYVIGGIQRRATSVGNLDMSENDPFAGVGVSLGGLFIEGRMEFNSDDPALPDFDNDAFIFMGGIIIG